MAGNPSEAVKLFGTEEPSSPARILQAGALTAEFDAGNLRHIRFDGVEVMRALSFIVRDRNWATYNPELSELRIEETEVGFKVAYLASTRDAQQEFRYRAAIEGSSDGHLSFSAEGEAVTDFLTNRTGFVVLHAIAGVAGHTAEIEHVDGSRVGGRFPELIDPVQPMMALRALTHEAAPGLRVTCRMEGDTFEMEDQRNWTDASYKTYVRPLALPWPYTLAAGTRLEQSVTLTVSGRPVAAANEGGAVRLVLGEAMGPAPDLGIGFDPGEASATRAVAEALAAIKPGHLICHHDPRRGHDAKTLEEATAIAAALGAKPWLEAVITEPEDYEREVTALAETVNALGSPFETVLLSPASDLKSTLPGSVWPPAAPADDLFRLAREAFPGARLGGGMFSFFTELNRKRPPLERLDFVSFTTSPLVHAGDDLSVMESLESLPSIAASARAIAGGLPLAVGPSSIGMRMNPYGAAPMENPGNIRQAMNRNDPRQRGLLGAAWTLGYFAHFARGGAIAVAFGGTTGASGLVHTPQAWPQPWYDEKGGLFPLFHVLRGLANLSGRTMLALEISDPSTVQGIASEGAQGPELWLANLTGKVQQISLPAPASGIAVLDASSFVEASQAQDLTDRLASNGTAGLTLAPFAVARVRLAS